MSSPVTRWATRLAYHLYVASLILFVPILVLLPLHLAFMARHNIEWVDGDRAGFTATAPPEVGVDLPVYRYHGGWKLPLGHARVLEVRGEEVVVAWEPAAFRDTPGGQATVRQVDDGVARVVGDSVGLRVDQDLTVFQGHEEVGRLRVVEVGGRYADLAILHGDPERMVGGQITGFVAPNQVAYPTWSGLYWLDALAIGLAVLWALFRRVGGASTLAVQAIRTGFARLARWRMLWHTLAGPFLIHLFVLVSFAVLVRLTGEWNLLSPDGPWWPGWLKWSSTLVLSVAYEVELWRTGRSPVVRYWHALRFRPPSYRWTEVFQRWLPWFDRRAAVWLLHLPVAYAYTFLLADVLRGNIGALAFHGWLGVPLGFDDWPATLRSLGVMATTPPHFVTPADVFGALRIVFYSVTMAGAICGYVHSVISVLWGKHIRDVDFTVLGWVTNAICYGPLIGGAWHAVAGGWAGPVPGISDGPLFWYVMSLELLLNILYSAAIWNMWTMFGVMVDKGVRRWGLFGVVRHPCYTLEVFMFTALMAPHVDYRHLLVAPLGTAFLYYLRCERDDVFMSASNPEYLEYKEQVPWKYFPGLW